MGDGLFDCRQLLLRLEEGIVSTSFAWGCCQQGAKVRTLALDLLLDERAEPALLLERSCAALSVGAAVAVPS